MNLIYSLLRQSKLIFSLSVSSGLIAAIVNTSLLMFINQHILTVDQNNTAFGGIFLFLVLLTVLSETISQSLFTYLSNKVIYQLQTWVSNQILALPLSKIEQIWE